MDIFDSFMDVVIASTRKTKLRSHLVFSVREVSCRIWEVAERNICKILPLVKSHFIIDLSSHMIFLKSILCVCMCILCVCMCACLYFK